MVRFTALSDANVGYNRRKQAVCHIAMLISCLGWPSAFAASPYAVQETFDGTDGYLPNGVIVDSSGNEYGITGGGGTQYCQGVMSCGIIYKIDNAGHFFILYNFEEATGVGPTGKLVLREQKLYGMTSNGGSFGQGVVFSIKTDGTQYTILHNFDGLDGTPPVGSIVLDASGDIFGVTRDGGPAYNPQMFSYGYGVLFEIAADGTFSQLHQFTGGADGGEPSGIVRNAAGNLYGATTIAGTTAGTVYEFAPATNEFATLYTFPGNGNTEPYIADVGQKGLIYGYQSSLQNSENLYGAVFELTSGKAGYTYTALHNFTATGSDGAYPTGLTVTGPGQMVGVTEYGSFAVKPHADGTIFTYDSGAFTTLYDFQLNRFGKYPNASPPSPLPA